MTNEAITKAKPLARRDFKNNDVADYQTTVLTSIAGYCKRYLHNEGLKMYKLTELEIRTIAFAAATTTGKHLGTDDQVCRFVEKYEQDPDRSTGSNQKIRYEANKRGFTLGELEVLLNLPGGTISNASQNRNERTDAILSLFFGIPQDELRTVPTGTPTSRTAKIKKIVALLRNLANELETI